MAEGEAWEAELRRVLAGQASHGAPPVGDIAGTVLARARRSARRRNVGRLAAVVAATLLTTGLLQVDWQPPAQPEFGAVSGRVAEPVNIPGPAEVRLAADDRLAAELSVPLLRESAAGGTVLATPQGELIDLRRIGQVRSAQRLTTGWVVVSGEPGSLRVWWVTAGSGPVSVLAGLDAAVVEGDRVAWQRLGFLATARLVAGELVDRVTTTGLGEGEQPVGILGDSVLLRRPDDVTGGGSWDVWHPRLGPYHPTWTDEVEWVYGTLSTGGGVLGLVPALGGAGPHCLARLDDRQQLATGQVRCLPVDLSPVGPAALSPDRRWLFATTTGGEAVIVWLEQLFDPAAAVVVLPVPDAPAPVAAPVWLSDGRLFWTTDDALVLVSPDQLEEDPTAVQVVPLAGKAPVAVGAR